jgi:hypothetical protein
MAIGVQVDMKNREGGKLVPCTGTAGKASDKWEQPFRAKLEEELLGKGVMFLMGNIHRFQGQWLIVSLIYQPKQRPAPNPQTALF